MSVEKVHVAAGVIINPQGEILIARRPDHVHQGGLWEFPGGKIETDEATQDALFRELHEELGITVEQCHPLIRIHYDYPDKSVLLDVWKVDAFSGEAHGREGQAIKWVTASALSHYDFPAANDPIVRAAQLPAYYLISPEPANLDVWLLQLEASLKTGINLVQLRANNLSDKEYLALALKANQLCQQNSARLLLNCDPDMVEQVHAAGVHLNSKRLLACRERPLARDYLVAASVHNEQELQHAMNINVDFVVLSPVKPTESHSDATPIGWEMFYNLTEQAHCPVYALGGMAKSDLDEAYRHGAQGIAAISSLWCKA